MSRTQTIARNTPALFLAGDLVFISLHIALRLANRLEAWPMFSIYRDGGYPEVFQYVKEAGIAVALVAVAFRAREYRYLAWSALFFFLLLDDSLGIHELIGGQLVAAWQLSSHLGIRGQDFGELAAEALTGGLLLAALAFCYWRGSARFRKVSRQLFSLLMIVIFFGVFVDSLHFLYEINWKMGLLMVVIEDGGEMVGMSLAVWYAIRLLQCNGKVEKSLVAVLLDRRGVFTPIPKFCQTLPSGIKYARKDLNPQPSDP